MSYQLLSETTLRARKPYRCIWCGESIPAGERHVREASVYDGNFQNHRWHSECKAAADTEFGIGEDEFYPYENDRPTKT